MIFIFPQKWSILVHLTSKLGTFGYIRQWNTSGVRGREGITIYIQLSEYPNLFRSWWNSPESLFEARTTTNTHGLPFRDQGGPRERGLGGALHIGYYAICFPKYEPNSTKFGMTTDRDKDNWDPPRTTIMEAKGNHKRGDKGELYMEVIRSFNFLNMP